MWAKKVRVGTGKYFKRIKGFTTYKIVLESTLYQLQLASKTSFTEWYAKPSRAPTLICLPCCAILACSKARNWDRILYFRWIPKLRTSYFWWFLVTNQESVLAKAIQWVCPRFISVVCWYLGNSTKLHVINVNITSQIPYPFFALPLLLLQVNQPLVDRFSDRQVFWIRRSLDRFPEVLCVLPYESHGQFTFLWYSRRGLERNQFINLLKWIWSFNIIPFAILSWQQQSWRWATRLQLPRILLVGSRWVLRLRLHQRLLLGRRCGSRLLLG